MSVRPTAVQITVLVNSELKYPKKMIVTKSRELTCTLCCLYPNMHCRMIYFFLKHKGHRLLCSNCFLFYLSSLNVARKNHRIVVQASVTLALSI